MSQKISLVVVTLNEQGGIERCIRSADCVDEVIVVDSKSDDKTQEIARSLGAKVVEQQWLGYSKQKQFATDLASNDWVLLLDGDECLSSELNEEIKSLKLDANLYSGYYLKEKEVFMGKLLSHGKSISKHIRLYNRKFGSYDEKIVHESFSLEGSAGCLNHHIHHYSTFGVKERLFKIIKYMDLELTNHSYRPTKKQLFWEPTVYFLSYFFKKAAWKDGVVGVIFLILCTFQIFLQHAAQFEKNIKQLK